jgi:hypothetical protein
MSFLMVSMKPNDLRRNVDLSENELRRRHVRTSTPTLPLLPALPKLPLLGSILGNRFGQNLRIKYNRVKLIFR